MKNKMLWIGSVIILILSVICFVVFGVGTELIRVFTGEGNALTFGKYDGKEIKLVPGTDFANAVQNYTNYYQQTAQQQGRELSQNDYLYIYAYAFNAAVQATAYKDAVNKSGYKPSGKAISHVMLPYFLNADGKYDPKLYSQVSNADKESLKSNIARQLVWQRYNDDLFGASEKLGDYTFYGLKESEKETSFLASLGAETRAFDTVSFDKSSYPDSEAKKFGAENAALFDTYALSVITVKDETQAKKLLAQLNNGEITFEDAVSEYSEKYYSDGDGKIKENFAYQITDNLANEDDFAKISALSADSLSEVLKTNTGYSIYKRTGEKTAANLEETATFDAVKKYITVNKQSMIEDYFTAQAQDFIANAKSNGFAEAAKEAGLEVGSIPAFPLNYGNASILGKIDSANARAFSNAGTNEAFLEKAFSMQPQDISEPMTLGNYVTVFQLVSVQQDADASAEEKRTEIASTIQEYDENSAQSVLLSSTKIENNVMDAYNKIISR